MRHLRALPRSSDLEGQPREVAVVSGGSREVVYLDDDASLQTITDALRAWGLSVRAQRAAAKAQELGPESAAAGCAWQTTRPDGKAPTRLENEFSPLWFPIRETDALSEATAPWDWFGRAA